MVKNASQRGRDEAYFAMFDREIDSQINEQEGITGFQILIMLCAICGFFFMLYVVAHDFGLI